MILWRLIVRLPKLDGADLFANLLVTLPHARLPTSTELPVLTQTSDRTVGLKAQKCLQKRVPPSLESEQCHPQRPLEWFLKPILRREDCLNTVGSDHPRRHLIQISLCL